MSREPRRYVPTLTELEAMLAKVDRNLALSLNGHRQRRLRREMDAENDGFGVGSGEAMDFAALDHAEPFLTHPRPFKKRRYRTAWLRGYYEGWSK